MVTTNKTNQLSPEWIAYLRKAQDYTYGKIKEVENREVDKTYAEYYSLTEHQRKSLDATNYWRVMQGERFIDVPETDIYFWRYFYPRAFELAKGWQEGENRKKEYEIIEKARKEQLRKEKEEADALEAKIKAEQPVINIIPPADKKKLTKKKSANNQTDQPSLF